MSPPTESALISRLTVHPLREDLYGELHARPTRLIEVPVRASHVAFLATPDEVDQSREHVARLARRYGTSAPVADASFYHGRFGGFDLRWEKHTEFFSITAIRGGVGDDPFAETAFALLPEDWVAAMPGCLVVATHATMLGPDTPAPDARQLRDWFEGQLVVGSRITGERAACWTTFRMHRDGFCRYLIQDKGLSAFQAGRTLQRVLELETYRVLSLMALPVARELASETTRLDGELASIMDRFMAIRTPADEQALLEELSSLAALVERHRSTTNYRFGATRAYSSLVNEILEDLREERFPGMSSMAKFLERRLGPGVRTCLAMEDRLEGLSQRVGRASDLLQARINVNIETQNQALLTAMNERSGMQLRLQQTVEGLSVAAISYYTVALLKLLFESLEEAGLPIRAEIATGVALPLVVFAVWRLVRRIRRHITGRPAGDDGSSGGPR
jgi:uncharacterized membrane-anchored protein